MHDSELKQWLGSSSAIHAANELLPAGLTLRSVLEAGGQGIVFTGEHNDQPAAIKVYFPGQLEERIDREVRALERINCPSIVSLLWKGTLPLQDRALPVVVTELIEGVPLDQRIEDNALTKVELSSVGYDVALAIETMWQYRIVHRDLKPSNILIKSNGRACVIDLGVARHIEESSLTAMGATWGTYGYLSPEQTRGVRQLTCKSDIYALGVVLIEAALGMHPTGRDQLRLFSRRLHETLPTALDEWEFADLLKTMLHPRPTKRPKPKRIVDELSAFAPPVDDAREL